MNTYLVPTTDSFSYEPYTCLFMVYAETPEEAYLETKKQTGGNYVVQKSTDYECYPYRLCIPYHLSSLPFNKSKKRDILNEVFKYTKGAEYMGHFNVNWNNYTKALAVKAIEENWSSKTNPNNGILANYLFHTYKKLESEKTVILTKDYGLFNTGLFNNYYDPIYAYSDSNYKIEFLTGYELETMKNIYDKPPRANYFEKPELLLFDWHYPIAVQFDHILNDEKNKERLPQSFLNSPNKITILTGAIELMKKRVSTNYKLAIPQYFTGKIQLLLPLCLDSDNGKPNLALAVTQSNNCYQGHTCLTLDMAYNNARLIAKPETDWLICE